MPSFCFRSGIAILRISPTGPSRIWGKGKRKGGTGWRESRNETEGKTGGQIGSWDFTIACLIVLLILA